MSKINLLFPIMLISFTNFVNIISGDYVIFQHPTGIANHYLEKRPTDDIYLNNMGRYSYTNNDEEKKLCMISFQAMHFKLIPKEVDPEYEDLQPYITNSLRDVEEYYAQPTNPELLITMKIQFNLDGISFNKLLTCFACLPPANNIWAIKYGYINHNYFYVVGSNNGLLSSEEPAGELVGLVEKVLTKENTFESSSSQDTRMLQTALNWSQKAKKKKAVDIKSIHDLDSFDRLRACSSVYMVLEGNDGADRNIQYFVREVENLWYMIKTSEVIDHCPENSDQDIIDIIPCAINNALTLEPQFYITLDHSLRGLAFVLKRKDGKVKVIMRVEKVLGLDSLYGMTYRKR